MYTKQEAFDIAAAHLMTQGRTSMGPEIFEHMPGYCALRGEDSRKCAIGALIPDELYCTSMERLNARTLIEKFPQLGVLFDPADIEFYRSLQMAHDAARLSDGKGAVDLSALRGCLEVVAARYSLDDSVLAGPRLAPEFEDLAVREEALA